MLQDFPAHTLMIPGSLLRVRDPAATQLLCFRQTQIKTWVARIGVEMKRNSNDIRAISLVRKVQSDKLTDPERSLLLGVSRRKLKLRDLDLQSHMYNKRLSYFERNLR